MRKKGLNDACFADFFSGPPPSFGYSESKRKSAGRKTEENDGEFSGLVSPGKKKEEKKKKHKPKEKPGTV